MIRILYAYSHNASSLFVTDVTDESKKRVYSILFYIYLYILFNYSSVTRKKYRLKPYSRKGCR
nr:MAG TPA: hypothetical protein [Caudoviricetes sp.]